MTPEQEEQLSRAAAKGDEDAQHFLASYYLNKTASSENVRQWQHWVDLGCTFAMLAAAHGRVTSVRLYANGLRAIVAGGDLKPESADTLKALVGELEAAIADRAPGDRVEVRL